MNTISKPQITFDDFLAIKAKLDIQIGQVVSAERIPKSKKLLKLTVIFGEMESDEKTVVTNLGDKFEPDDFLGARMPFIMNLTPSPMMGVVSEAMIIVGTDFRDNITLTDYPIGAKLM